MLSYDFGPSHPLRPERLARAIELASRYGFSATDPGVGERAQALRVHDPLFVDYVSLASRAPSGAYDYGFAFGDNPAFQGMYEASLTYLAGTVAAAQQVSQGTPLAISLGGGLHHARRSQASGFCIFNDPAVAIHVLLERFEKVAYVDIDVHHGDGVQWIWYDEPRVLTCSIHQDGRTLYPGTGGVEETGKDYTAVNVPMAPGTTGDVWLWAFEEVIMAALAKFAPDAIVLQMGTDAHKLDPLARLNLRVQDWLGAIEMVKALSVPVVAVGGGGYNLNTVPRMWVAACLTLTGQPIPDRLPAELAERWNVPAFLDPDQGESNIGREEAEAVVRWHARLSP